MTPVVTWRSDLSPGDGGAPRITEQPTNELVVRGQPVTLNCKAEGEPTPRVSWFKDGRPLVAGQGLQRFFLHGSSLYFVEVRREEDAGVYWCEATNRHGAARSRNATLHIAGGCPRGAEQGVGTRQGQFVNRRECSLDSGRHVRCTEL